MNFLLKIKHWHLFLIILLLPLIVSVGLMTLFNFILDRDIAFTDIYAIVYYSIFLSWNYVVIRTFNKKESILKPKQLRKLDWLLVILIVYVLLVILSSQFRKTDLLVFKILSIIILLISFYAFFYTVFCTAKTLKGIQLKDQVRTADIIVEMFIILYFPIGLWWIQKKVNQYYKEL